MSTTSEPPQPEPPQPEPPQPERLQKVLARAGFGSRRHCEELIASGRVEVNGRTASLGDRVDPAADTVEVDGVAVEVSSDVVYLALHKPEGVVTTARDPSGRPTVIDLVPKHPRVFPVGRLDRDTSGLLLLTNDGDFSLRVTHPRYGVGKVYVARVSGGAGRRAIARLRSGVHLADGPARAEDVRVLSSTPRQSLLEVRVREGRNRLVRRMLDEVGLPVLSLTRTQIGPVKLGRLKPGAYRTLSRQDVLELLAQTGTARPRPPEPPAPAAAPAPRGRQRTQPRQDRGKRSRRGT